MATTITITRSIREQGGANYQLISAGQRLTMDFTIEETVVQQAYMGAIVELDVYTFKATKISSTSSIGTYRIDLTSILASYLGQPPMTITELALSKDFQLVIKAINTQNNTELATLSDSYSRICYGCEDTMMAATLDNVYNLGAKRTIYHNGTISFFFRATAFTSITLTINGVSNTYTGLSQNGYQIIHLIPTQRTSGVITGVSSGTTFLTANVVYANAGDSQIAWINKDGAWSLFNLNYRYKKTSIKRAGEIALTAISNQFDYAKNINTAAEKTVTKIYDTIALNLEHYILLCEIAESPRIIIDGRVAKIKDIPDSISECRQNLKFNLSLEFDENIISL